LKSTHVDIRKQNHLGGGAGSARVSQSHDTRALMAAAVALLSMAAVRGHAEPATSGAKPVNHPPTVKILSPKANEAYEENSQVRYEIDVSDKEDGLSKFREINPTEVLLMVRYFSSTAAAEAAMSGAITGDPAGLGTIRTSNCLSCHAFDATLIGPSFADIRKRYTYTQANVDTLSRHILEGSSGNWGRIKMPSHPEWTSEQAAACVTWILKTAADPQTSYYTGTEGSFRVAVPQESQSKGKGMLVLIASYIDHGLKDDPGQRMQGRDTIRIQIK
jgi:cytochrome c